MARSSASAQIQAAAVKAAKEMAAAQREVAIAFDRAAQSLRSFALAGLAGTTMGERLTFQQQMLRREITQLFLPALEQVSRWLNQVTNWFRQLTGAQQENLGKWLLIGTAALGVLLVLPKVVATADALAKSWKALSLVFAANPFIAVLAGLVAVEAMTEQGRTALEEMGKQGLRVFEEVGQILSSVLLPALELLSELLSGSVGKIIVWSTAFLMAIRAVQAAFAGLSLTMLGAGAIVAGMIAVVGLLAAAFGKSEFRKFGENLAAEVRKGRISLEEAERELENKRIERQLELERQYRGEGKSPTAVVRALYRLGTQQTPEELARKESQEELEKTRQRLREETRDRRRHELQLSQTAQEDPRRTIQRIQEAALKVQTPTDRNTEKTAENTEAMKRILEELLRKVNPFGTDNRERPPKED
jgi:hypothetical protein